MLIIDRYRWNSSNILPKFLLLTVWRKYYHYNLSKNLSSSWMLYILMEHNICFIKREFQSVLLVEEAGVPGKNHRPWAGNWQTLLRAMRVKRNPFLYGTNPGAISRRIGDRLQWSVQVSLNQLPRPLGHPGPSTIFEKGLCYKKAHIKIYQNK